MMTCSQLDEKVLMPGSPLCEVVTNFAPSVLFLLQEDGKEVAQLRVLSRK